MAPVEVRPVTNRSELNRFIYLPGRIHRAHPNWIPPIYPDDKKYFDTARNPACAYSDTLLVLAWEGKEVVGRNMGIVNRRHNELRQERTARFGYTECYENPDVFNSLMTAVEDWGRAKGMNRIVGPMGFSDQDPEGWLIEGFDVEPTLTSYINFEYLVKFIEARGYVKEIDYVDYLVELPEVLPRLYERILTRLSRQSEFRLLEFKTRNEIKPYIHKVFQLMNATYSEASIYGYVPMTEHEMDELAKQYLPIVDPRFIKAVARGEEVVAFVIGIPNINPGLRKARGELFPFGILHLLSAMKKSKQLDLFLGAIRADCRGRGLDVMMGAAMMRSAIGAGYKRTDSHHEMETNLQVRAEMERVGGKVAKRFRIFQKSL
jgi:hypothetical protein